MVYTFPFLVIGFLLPYQFQVFRGEEIKERGAILNEWAVRSYRGFPYLYVSDGEELQHQLLGQDPQSFVLLGMKNDQMAALFVAYPLDSAVLNFKYSLKGSFKEMEEKGFEPAHYLYAASFLVAEEERDNQALVQQIYRQASQLAQELGKKGICYFTTIREENHPLKPNPYVPVEPWEFLSPKSMGITFELEWPTLQADGSVETNLNSQEIYYLDL